MNICIGNYILVGESFDGRVTANFTGGPTEYAQFQGEREAFKEMNKKLLYQRFNMDGGTFSEHLESLIDFEGKHFSEVQGQLEETINRLKEKSKENNK